MSFPVPIPSSCLSSTDIDRAYLEMLASHSSIFCPFLDSSAECGGWSAVVFDGGGHSVSDTKPIHLFDRLTVAERRASLKHIYRDCLNKGVSCI